LSTSRYINNLSDEEQELTRSLAFELVRQQQRHLVISPWSLICSVLMQSGDGITVRELVRETEWLKRQATNNGGYVDWPGMYKRMVLISEIMMEKPSP
jgi:hypothetical protein